MDWKILLTVFGALLLAELGDKSQLATMLFASDKTVGKWSVFLGASLALIVASGISVLAGSALSHILNPKLLGTIAGVGFIAIGVFTLYRSLTGG